MSEEINFLTIKEASKILGVNPETLRRWDKAGKLKTKRHPMNNYRIYDADDINKLKQDILPKKSNQGGSK
ncbi:MerR family transcriptional regulator [bacterium]|jgi:site-specific DNA-methyltransferase (adenine-specific)|nr:MerR family transcriptional regulator [bacterium]